MKNPHSHNWDNFWKKNPTDKQKSISWSKRRILCVIEPYTEKGKRILDAGCGSGFFSKYFLDQGLQVVSLDYSDQALELTRRMTEGAVRVIKHDLLSQDVSKTVGEKFDIIFSDGLLEHFAFQEQCQMLKNFSSLLKDKGILLTFVPNRWSPWELMRPFFMPGIGETPFMLKNLVHLLSRNGFSILQAGGINVLPFSFSPDQILGSSFGMLLYAIARKNVPSIR